MSHRADVHPPAASPWATAGLTLLAMVAFAANSLLCRAALVGGHADAVSFTTLRLASGTVVLALLVRLRLGSFPVARPAWGPAAALFGYAIGFSLAYLRIPAGAGALLLFSAVQLTMIAAGLRAGDRPSAVEWVGFVLSIAGLVVLTHPGLARPDPAGAGLMLAAGMAWGLYSLSGRRSQDAILANASGFAYAMPFALVMSAMAIGGGTAYLRPEGALLAAASGAITSGLGYAVWYAALRGLTVTRAAIVQLSVPPLAATGGVLVLGEPSSVRLVAASALTLGGIALSTLGRRRR